MRVSINWLNDYVDIKNIPTKELADRLTLAGLEVEGIVDIKAIDGIVTAKVVECGKHPNADKLSLCTVSDGANEYQVVCGAKNVAKDKKVVLAKIGAVLPEITIKEATIRDVKSCGMLCSYKELGIDDSSEGIIILNDDCEVGVDANTMLGLGDTLFELNVTPNRADWLSVVGVAREISAIFNLELKLPKYELKKIKGETKKYIKVVDIDKAPIYAGRVIRNVKVASSTELIKSRLRSAEIRSINNIVDATNYILIEFGQPLHAFDYDKIDGGIIVRNATDGETIITLDDKERKLDKDMLLIADEHKPLVVAGVMGGLSSSVTDDAKDIFLEIAYFEPTTIRKTSKKLGLSSDSSYRYERGVDYGNTINIADYASYLIAKVSGGDVVDVSLGGVQKDIAGVQVVSGVKYINELLGTDIKADDMVSILNRLCIMSEVKNDNIISSIPTFRVDIYRDADIAEEVARIFGYDNIAIKQSAITHSEKVDRTAIDIERYMQRSLATLGFNECINYSFLSEDYLYKFIKKDGKYVELINPISTDMAIMRRLLFPSLLKSAETNWNQSERNLQLFEIGATYESVSKEKLAIEDRKISAITLGSYLPLSWVKGADIDNFYQLKGVVENLLDGLHLQYCFKEAGDISYLHPKKSARVFINDIEVGILGELHPTLQDGLDLKSQVNIFEASLQKLVDIVREKKLKYKEFSRFQVSERDISLLIKSDVPADSIIDTVKSVSSLITDVTIFDIYSGDKIEPGYKSIAFRVKFQDMNKTLSDDEINALMLNIVNSLEHNFPAKQR